MIAVCVVVFNRLHNMLEQIRCWKLCETQGAELIIIHNYDSLESKESYSKLCLEAGVRYIPHENVGYDIGRLQDICKGRLEGFPDFEHLIWLADDALPMRKDFIKQYMDVMKQPKVGCAALHISNQVRKHIRTTGFCITKKVASKLKFPADPITTKEQCYRFEHRAHMNTFLDQIYGMGLIAVQVSPIETACFWDSGFKRYLNREEEHYKHFPKFEKDLHYHCIR